jgi:hypothetical protein
MPASRSDRYESDPRVELSEVFAFTSGLTQALFKLGYDEFHALDQELDYTNDVLRYEFDG